MSLQFRGVHFPGPLSSGPAVVRRNKFRAALLLAFAVVLLALTLTAGDRFASASTEDELNDTKSKIAEQKDKSSST